MPTSCVEAINFSPTVKLKRGKVEKHADIAFCEVYSYEYINRYFTAIILFSSLIFTYSEINLGLYDNQQ